MGLTCFAGSLNSHTVNDSTYIRYICNKSVENSRGTVGGQTMTCQVHRHISEPYKEAEGQKHLFLAMLVTLSVRWFCQLVTPHYTKYLNSRMDSFCRTNNISKMM